MRNSYRMGKSRMSTKQKKRRKKKKEEKSTKITVKVGKNISILAHFLHFQMVINVFIQTYEKCNHLHTCFFILETLFVEILPKIIGFSDILKIHYLAVLPEHFTDRYYILQPSEPVFLIQHASL